MSVIESGAIEVPISFKAVIELLKDAIYAKRLVKFYYESGSGNKGWRIIPPYMIIPGTKNLELVGVPITELKKGGQPRHYTIYQLSERQKSQQFKILPETFNDPGVSKDKVVFTGTPPIFRFIYKDEDPKSTSRMAKD